MITRKVNIEMAKSKATINLYDNPASMEPLLPNITPELERLAITILQESAAFEAMLHPVTRKAVAELVKPMNVYYSNAIEGQYTLPLDIEKALKKDFSTEPEKEALQKLALALASTYDKMRVKLETNGGNVIFDKDFIAWLHESFYRELPEVFRKTVTTSGKILEVKAGHFREIEVQVATHIGPKAEALPVFLDRFCEYYSSNLTAIEKVVALAASHHRLAWIHPFTDGNGRVARLFSDAFLLHLGLDSAGMWSISRGLARRKADYYSALSIADRNRSGDYDGRGNLTNKGLEHFCVFFLETCIDQIRFIKDLLQTDKALERLTFFMNTLEITEGMPAEAKYILRESFLVGWLQRGEMERITNLSAKTARNIMTHLIAKNFLVSEDITNPKKPVRINFSVELARKMFPELYPTSALS